MMLLAAWAKLCRASTKESGRRNRGYAAGRHDLKLLIADLKLDISDCQAMQRPEGEAKEPVGCRRYKGKAISNWKLEISD
jgi:hypothetical protein